MTRARMLIVSGDDWIARLVASAIRDRGGDPAIEKTAEGALRRMGAHVPDLLVVDASLPNHPGTWLAERVRRGETTRLVPILVLAHVDDSSGRAATLRAGADACLNKPFRVEEAMAQIEALAAMAARGRARPSSPPRNAAPAPAAARAPSAALEGNLAELSLPTVLTLLEMERRSGVLEVVGARQSATVVMLAGAAASATLAGAAVAPIAVLRRVMKWKTGRFSFRAGPAAAPDGDRRSIGALLIEAARLEDESPPPSTAGELEPIPSIPPSVDVAFDDEPPTARRDAGPPSRRPAKRSAPSAAPQGGPKAPRAVRKSVSPESHRSTRPAPAMEGVSFDDLGARKIPPNPPPRAQFKVLPPPPPLPAAKKR